MSEIKLYQITEKQAEIIREALSSCDGEWWVAVRWGEDWDPISKKFGHLFGSDGGSDGTHIAEGIKGLEVALCFSPETTKLGDVHKVLECSEIRGIRIEGNYRKVVKITDISPLEKCSLLQGLVLSRCRSLVDIFRHYITH
jgi:hypothetical protein